MTQSLFGWIRTNILRRRASPPVPKCLEDMHVLFTRHKTLSTKTHEYSVIEIEPLNWVVKSREFDLPKSFVKLLSNSDRDMWWSGPSYWKKYCLFTSREAAIDMLIKALTPTFNEKLIQKVYHD